MTESEKGLVLVGAISLIGMLMAVFMEDAPIKMVIGLGFLGLICFVIFGFSINARKK